jgi:hypothetical protein
MQTIRHKGKRRMKRLPILVTAKIVSALHTSDSSSSHCPDLSALGSQKFKALTRLLVGAFFAVLIHATSGATLNRLARMK